MANLVEFKVTKTLWDDVKNDTEFYLGFEAEFHCKYASDLLRDQNDQLPRDFETFNFYDEAEVRYDHPIGNVQQVQQEMAFEETALIRLCRLFEKHLGLPEKDILIEDSGYTKWKLMVDPSLTKKPGALANPDDDIGVELISPVLPLKEGLIWIGKVFDMIAKFAVGDMTLYTTDLCGFHLNLSHTRMGPANFDYAKLAILSGDEHYLQDFNRVRNVYTAPLMQAVYNELVTAKENPTAASPKTAAALNLLRLRGWSSQRVMSDLSTLIPMSHHFSVDLAKLQSDNPYIEIRIAGNAGYEKRFDEIGQLAIRFGALIKIGCDPTAYREEYLKKVYQMVANVTTAQPTQPQPVQAENPFPRLRIYLTPILSSVTRRSLDMMETYWRGQTLTVSNGSYLALAIIRSAIDLRQQDTPRIRQGVTTLLRSVLRIEPIDLLKVLRNNALLLRYGVIRSSDKPLQAITMLTNYIKSLNQPVAKTV
jgi:hypothetical protein